MDTKSMTRQEFVTLTFTLLGSAAAATACSSMNTNGEPPGSVGPGACGDPLPETQLPDSTQHTHTVTIPAADLSATSDQTFNTSLVYAHMHMVTLTVAELGTIKGGGSVTVTATAAGTPSHTHMYMISCAAGGGSGG